MTETTVRLPGTSRSVPAGETLVHTWGTSKDGEKYPMSYVMVVIQEDERDGE